MTDELDNITEDELYRATNGLPGSAYILAGALPDDCVCRAIGGAVRGGLRRGVGGDATMKPGVHKSPNGYSTCIQCRVSKPNKEFDKNANGRIKDKCRVCLAAPRQPRRNPSKTRKPRAYCGVFEPERCDTRPVCMFFPRCRAMLQAASKMARAEQRPSIGRDGVELPCFPSSVHHADFLEYYAPDEGETDAPPEVVRVGSVITVTDSLRQMIISGD